MNSKEIFDLLSEIEYGWLDKDNIKHYIIDDNYSKNYILQGPKQVISNKIGVCWDQVELERFYFANSNCIVKTYFIVYYDGDKCPTHTFLAYEDNGNYYWFEHSWLKYEGIHEYKSLKELLNDVRNKFIADVLENDFNKYNLCVFEYSKPKYGISAIGFYKHCENGKNIDIDRL